MISINEHHEAIACVSDIDRLIKSATDDANLHHTNNNPLPNFSIRDYVYASRCKDIECNWPFSTESLQLCLNSGVKNLLPPFESLDSLMSYNRVRNDKTVSIFDNKSTNDGFVSLVSSSIKSQCHLEEKLVDIKSNSQRTVMKLNSGVDLVKEIMAFKVCPVCKTFSSSSNNTLNAHIDRCLSGESSKKSPEILKIKTVKHRIKPRRSRLMLDIYKTATHCTIEELDKRNGTNWATNSSFPDQEHEFQVEEKKEETQKNTSILEIAEHEDHEGDVYIDSNGTKIRILSTTNFSKLNDNEARKLQKGRKRIKFVSKKKNGDVQKNLKKIADKQAISGQEEPMKAQVHKQMDDLAITRPPWACSKRTSRAKKRKFQDSLKHKSRSEEDTDEKLPFDLTVNDQTLIPYIPTFNSGGVEIASKSVGTDQVPFQGCFTGLRMVAQLDNKLDSRVDIENQGNYFKKTDPIPIPGPPGSFLPPSPGATDIVSEEEIQGNSSLTATSRVQSSDQDHFHHDMMNHDFISESPISNVSSPTYAKSSDKLSVNTGDLRLADAIFTESGPTHFRCSRNESAYRVESSERVLESNMRPNSLNFRPDLLSLTLPPPQTFKSPGESSVKLPVSPTTPVLRLMGKNLIVVNTDEEQFRPHFGSNFMGHQPFHSLQNENQNKSYIPLHDSRTFAQVFREITVNDGNLGGWVWTENGSPSISAYYRRSFSLPKTQREDGV